MWKLKIGEGGNNPWLRSTNGHLGRQVWEFHPELGTSDEISQVEKAREEFRRNRFKTKNSSDLLLRLQYSKGKQTYMDLPPQKKLGESDYVTEEVVSTSIRRALSSFSTLQAHDGHWPADFGAPMFLLPGLIITLYITGALNTLLSTEHVSEMRRFLYNHQNEDGGWGFHIEGHSTMFGSVLSYVTLRLLGEEAEGGDGAISKGREWILQHGGATHTTQWGKFWLSVLGAFDWAGNNPLLPELMLLPQILPFHPSRMWILTRTVYLPMAYLYAKKFVGPITPTVLSLRQELYSVPYENINWYQVRNACAKEDLYVKHSLIQDIFWASLSKVEKIIDFWPFNKLRQKALSTAMQHIHYEDESTRYLCVGPIRWRKIELACDPWSAAFNASTPRWPADAMRLGRGCTQLDGASQDSNRTPMESARWPFNL